MAAYMPLRSRLRAFFTDSNASGNIIKAGSGGCTLRRAATRAGAPLRSAASHAGPRSSTPPARTGCHPLCTGRPRRPGWGHRAAAAPGHPRRDGGGAVAA
eukprot:CAMPEP_0204569490 /NCGR_PEP_ID=MMETSP0661-20131031/37773_1 /ASSEMBLY_ACC=CAM_ASM_000606 /TAXON_ID=109239 /ORGANISM="Alexandrium margalefi, Strain AMGDE01CS-322" /LENGTH=99 /DNA_ID=CAMNT_0051577597 /DNA_START=308 /DNA_END=604 /DNA_ORIENTATION=-